jgi:transcription initiation factor TFIIIB Brf1 subunit/transcription initiation factor TFIIB
MVIDSRLNIVCNSCGSSGSSLYIDIKIGEIVCTLCGVVQPQIWCRGEVYE